MKGRQLCITYFLNKLELSFLLLINSNYKAADLQE